MTDLEASPLGHLTTYPDVYAPELLFPVERAPQREELGLGADLPFRGEDRWNAYELSWLDRAGKPQVAIASFGVPADSPRIVESKSVKLYLASFNQARFADTRAVAAVLARDLSAATGADVVADVVPPEAFAAASYGEPGLRCIDELPCDGTRANVAPETLASGGPTVDEALTTRLFRSVCPVTGQPDFADVEIRYRGARIDALGLLAYLVSFRRHPGFHEHCVERIFVDIWRRCHPERLAVQARFTRRGGIDINPWRTSGDEPAPPNIRTVRQ